MALDIYLLWIPINSNGDKYGSWGVFDSGSCPDPGAFPDYMYKKYIVERENWISAVAALSERQEMLVHDKIVPSKENYNSIFPELKEDITDRLSN